MRKIIILICLLAAVFLGKRSLETAYFNQSLKAVTLEKFQDQVLEDDIKLIAIGERHDFFTTYDISLDFLKLLYESRDIRYFLLEFPPANAEYANRFVLSGKEKYLHGALDFPGLKNPRYKVQHLKFEKFFRDLYEFNRLKPLEDKVKLVGVDIEFRPYPFFNFLLNKVVEDRSMKDEIIVMLDRYPDPHSKLYTKDHIELLEKLLHNLGEELTPMNRYILENAIESSKLDQSNRFGLQGTFGKNKREAHIAKNMEYVSDLFLNETFILVIGYSHIFKDMASDFTSCIYLLNSNSSYFNGKITSVIIEKEFYIKSNPSLKNLYSEDKSFYKAEEADSFYNNFSFWPNKTRYNETSHYRRKYSDFYDYLIVK